MNENINKRRKIFYILGAIIILGLLVEGLSGAFFFKNVFLDKKIPEKYQNYLDLNTNKTYTVSDYVIKPFIKSEFYTEKFVSSKNELIVLSLTENPKEEYSGRDNATINYQKINRTGTIVSTYKKVKINQVDQEFVIGDYIVNPRFGYYNTWILDNDTTKKAFIPVNKDLSWSNEKQEELLDKINEKSPYYYKTNDYERPERFGSIVYFLDNKWYYFYTNFEKISMIKDHKGIWNEEYNNNSPEVQPVYMKITEYGSADVSNGSMAVGTHNVKTFDADFYCQIPFKKDTLKFKMSQSFFDDYDLEKKWWHIKGEDVQKYKKDFQKLNWEYSFFINKNFDFILFNGGSYDAENTLYIITSKKQIAQ